MEFVRKVVLLGLLLFLLFNYINSNQYISIFLEKSTGTCNKKYCNISIVCRPWNRTGKLSSIDVYFHQGVILEAPINVEIITYKKFRTLYRQHMLKLKGEMCSNIIAKNHPIYHQFKAHMQLNGNLLDPCPLTGHRYILPQITTPNTYRHIPLVPVGEWRLDIIVSKNINNLDEEILRWSDFYEVKATSAIEF